MVVGYFFHSCENGGHEATILQRRRIRQYLLLCVLKIGSKQHLYDEVFLNDICEKYERNRSVHCRENALHIDRRSGHISNKTLSSQRLTSYYEVSESIQGRLANYFTFRLF
jgi:hypothetical protein